MRAILLTMLLACACFAQSAPAPKETPEQEMERILGRPLNGGSAVGKPAPTAAALNECRAKLEEWQEWGRVNYPIGQQLSAANLQLMTENNRLTVENRELKGEVTAARMPIFFGLVAVGVGIAVAFMAIRFLWRKWRLSSAGKQLGVLVLGALWTTAAVFVALDKPSLSVHPINLAVTVAVYSLPAILFAGIAFWWFEKAKS